MKTFIIPVIISIIVGAAAAFIYIQFSSDSRTDVSRDYDLVPLKCDLMKKKCTKEFNGQTVTFDMTPRPVEIMAETTISLSGLNYDFYDAKIRIFGLNMDMGTIIASLVEKDNIYITKVALSACLVEDVSDQDIAAEDMAVEPFCEKSDELREHPLLFLLVVDIDKFVFPHLIAEKRMLGALADQLRITDLHHVFLLVGKMRLRIEVKLLEDIFQLLVIVAVIIGACHIVSF